MGVILDSTFTEAIADIIEYCQDKGMKESFIKARSKESVNYHKWKSVLYLRSCLGNTDISYEEAIQLLKTDMRDNVMVGNESEGYTNAQLDENGELETNVFEQFQLWIL